ncbi:MAG: protein kinase [Planctomycetes bacterium]|nr:protein kinase [Planctomycetota bacterium]
MERKIGDYRILRETGRGGMGVVYEAIQESLDRRVALKVLSSQLFRSPALLERFHKEAAAAARLRHPNIVPVYDSGSANGTPYYCMAYVEGRPLDALLAERGERKVQVLEESYAELAMEAVFESDRTAETPAEPSVETPQAPGGREGLNLPSREECRELAGRMAEVADALDYAHRNGVLHLDIKPSNLILDEEGRIVITDFGLAILDPGTGKDKPARAMGSPLYASPEILSGDFDAVGPTTDIYSLGVTLYECLTLIPPFAGPTCEAVVFKTLHDRPVPPRMYNPAIPRDLEQIVLKAIARDPAGRYLHAAEIAGDLHRFVAGDPVDARPVGPLRRLARKIVRNRPLLIALIATAIFAVAAGVAGWLALRPGPSAGPLFEDGKQALERGDLQTAISFLEAAYDLDDAAPHRRALIDVYQQAFDLDPTDWRIARKLGAVLGADKQYVRAEQVLRDALTIIARDPRAATNVERGDLYYDLGKALEDLEEYAKAEGAFLLVVEDNPEDARAWNMIGEMRCELDRWADAEKPLRRAVELRDDKAKYASNLGFALLQLGHLEEARAYCRKAVDLEPRSQNWRLNLADVELAREDFDEVANQLRAARRSSEKDTLSWVRKLPAASKDVLRREPAFESLREDPAFAVALGE